MKMLLVSLSAVLFLSLTACDQSREHASEDELTKSCVKKYMAGEPVDADRFPWHKPGVPGEINTDLLESNLKRGVISEAEYRALLRKKTLWAKPSE